MKWCPTICMTLFLPHYELETGESDILSNNISVECVVSVMHRFQQVQYMEIFICACTPPP